MKLFEDLPSTNTPINAENLNQIKDNLVVVSPTEPTGDNREKVWMQQGSLYNSKNNTNGYYLDSLGVETANGAWDLTEYIQVKPNGNYEISGVTVVGTSPYCAYYDNNKNFISSFKNSNGIITMPTNAYYVRFSINGADITGFKFELCPKIYVKNDNDVYEEFIRKGLEFDCDLTSITRFNSYYFNTNYTGYIKRNGNIVVMNIVIESSNDIATENVNAIQLPPKFRPKEWVPFSCGLSSSYGWSIETVGYGMIDTEGIIKLRNTSGKACKTAIINLTYKVDN